MSARESRRKPKGKWRKTIGEFLYRNDPIRVVADSTIKLCDWYRDKQCKKNEYEFGEIVKNPIHAKSKRKSVLSAKGGKKTLKKRKHTKSRKRYKKK